MSSRVSKLQISVSSHQELLFLTTMNHCFSNDVHVEANEVRSIEVHALVRNIVTQHAILKSMHVEVNKTNQRALCYVERDRFLQDANADIRKTICNTVSLNRSRAWIWFSETTVFNISGVYHVKISGYWNSDGRSASYLNYYIQKDFWKYKVIDYGNRQ